MKKGFISFLIMTLTVANISLVNISSVQAATTDNAVTTTDNSIKVSLDNIRDIMIENNLNIKNFDNAVKIAKEKFDDAKADYDDFDDYNVPDDEPTKPTEPDKSKYADEATYNTAESEYISKLETYTTYQNYKTAKKAYDTAKDDYKTAKTNYDQGVEDKVKSAESSYLDYLYAVAQEQLQEDTLKSNVKDEQISKIKYESGFMSKNDYITSQETNTDSNNTLKNLKDNLELTKLKLCNTLGISSSDHVTFETDITEDFNVISKINYDNDLNTMFNNNLTIKSDSDAIDDYEDQEDDIEDEYDGDEDVYNYTMKTKENSLIIDKNTAETDFKAQYNTLMNSYNSIKSNYDKIIQKQTVYKTNQTKFDYGFISQTDLDADKLKLDTDMATFIKDRNACYLEYLKYIQLKEGY